MRPQTVTVRQARGLPSGRDRSLLGDDPQLVELGRAALTSKWCRRWRSHGALVARPLGLRTLPPSYPHHSSSLRATALLHPRSAFREATTTYHPFPEIPDSAFPRPEPQLPTEHVPDPTPHASSPAQIREHGRRERLVQG